jgi:hypothetical protein
VREIAPLPRTGFKFMISVRSGPAAGATYQLLPPRVSIGRDSATNNVVLIDPRVSRNAAVIEFSPDEIVILDVSGKAKLSVNGIPGDRHSIKGGDVIQVGESELIFIVEALHLPVHNPPPTGGIAPVFPEHHGLGPTLAGNPRGRIETEPHLRSRRSRPKRGGGRGPLYLVVALILGGIIIIGKSEQNSKKLDAGLRTTSEIEKEISETTARVDALTKKRQFRTEEEKTRYEESQKHYLRGFRDYQKGNYTRAISALETAIGLDPENVLARRYYRLAQKQKDEVITNLLLEGRRYREKAMYARCSSAIEKALVLMTNKDDLKFKEAEKIKKECDLLLER